MAPLLGTHSLSLLVNSGDWGPRTVCYNKQGKKDVVKRERFMG